MANSNNSKAWLWRKISAEKNFVASDKSSRENDDGDDDDQLQSLLAEKAELEKSLKTLEHKLSSALSDCSAKDELEKKHVKMAQESIIGWDKAEEAAMALKSQLDEALKQRLASEERSRHLDTALKECMERLIFVREEQDQRIHDALVKASMGFERTQAILEERLSETSKRLSKAANENAHLGKALLLKDKLVEELTGQLTQVEEDFGGLMARLEATEKDNASFKYEVMVLEKELEIRNEEREFNRRAAEASHRQHLESAKKIAKLELECRRLRVLVRNRLPGPAALAKMKHEVEMLGSDEQMSAKTRSAASVSEVGSDESWDSPSVKEKQRGSLSKASEINLLMNDFAEIEKLATVSVETSRVIPIAVPLEKDCSSKAPIRAGVSSPVPPNHNKSIYKMIELIEGLGLPSTDFDNPEKFSRKNENGNSETPEGYVSRVLQWKTSELTAVLQQFVLSCYDLLNGKADINEFVRRLTVALEWIINHCFSLQDVSSMRDAIIKQCDWDDCESEAEVPRDSKVEERRKPKHELDSERKELELKLLSATETNDSLRKKLQESDNAVEALQTELEASRKERAMVEDRIEHQKATNEDLNTQLTVTRQELNEALQQFSSLEVELENKSSCFEELQATCVELELQLESMKKESPDADYSQVEKQLRTDREITAASERLAECQETILNLGKQLKALSTPKECAILDKIIVAPNDTTKTIAKSTMPTIKEENRMTRRTSLLDRMMADDSSATGDRKSPETKEIDSNSTTKAVVVGPYGPIEPLEKILVLGRKSQDQAIEASAVAIVSTKRSGGVSLLKRLLWRKKKGGIKKTSALSLAS